MLDSKYSLRHDVRKTSKHKGGESLSTLFYQKILDHQQKVLDPKIVTVDTPSADYAELSNVHFFLPQNMLAATNAMTKRSSVTMKKRSVDDVEVCLQVYHSADFVCVKPIAKEVRRIVDLVASLSTHKCEKPIKIRLWLTKLKKLIPKRLKMPLTCEHMNSGCTDLMSNTIVIWRQEELYKVLIHECIHVFRWDSMQDSSIATFCWKFSNFCPDHSNGPLLSEMYTEFFAILIYLGMRSSSPQDMQSNLDREIEHAMCSCIRIIRHYGLTAEKLRNPNNPTDLPPSAVHYYLCKTSLLFLLDKTPQRFRFLKESYNSPSDALSNNFVKVVVESFENDQFWNALMSRTKQCPGNTMAMSTAYTYQLCSVT